MATQNSNSDACSNASFQTKGLQSLKKDKNLLVAIADVFHNRKSEKAIESNMEANLLVTINCEMDHIHNFIDSEPVVFPSSGI